MDSRDLVARRLANQQIAGTSLKRPEALVAWFGAMQAQEWAMVQWALALRLPGCRRADIEKAFNAGRILRTHAVRPTWHFVAPADILWILSLTAPRNRQLSAGMFRQLELTPEVFRKSRAALVKALSKAPQLTRSELAPILAKAGIAASGMRLGYILFDAEVEGLICSGPRVGRQFTYALLAKRAPRAKTLPREEALAELSQRYFQSRGPATVQDFAAWSGLTVADCKRGVALLGKALAGEKAGSREWFRMAKGPRPADPDGMTFLLPDYDEYGMGYKDRSALAGERVESRSSGRRANIRVGEGGPITDHMVVVDGVVRGTWRRTVKGVTVHVDCDDFSSLGKARSGAVAAATRRYEAFFAGAGETGPSDSPD